MCVLAVPVKKVKRNEQLRVLLARRSDHAQAERPGTGDNNDVVELRQG